MKSLNSIPFSEILTDENYFITVEVDALMGGILIYGSSGKDLIEFLKETFDYESWFEQENEQHNGESFLSYATDLNGDGYDLILVYSTKF